MRYSAALLSSLLLVSLVAPYVFAADARPNVILILVDDLGWMDLSCQGSDYFQTPSIDRLAAEGMRFTDGDAACAVCSPSRAAVQTGRYPHRIGVTDWIRSRFQRGDLGTPDANQTAYVGGKHDKLLCPPNPYWMEHEERTIAEVLRENGYRCGYIGKWHLGDEDYYPERQGYHENRGGCDYGQPPSYFDPFNQPRHQHESIRAGIHNLPGRRPGQFLTHREADEAESLIRQWKDEPFFLQVAHYAVHTPIQAIPEVAAKYQGQTGKSKQNADYAAMVESVDDSLRQILSVLHELDLDERTLIILTSDNGGLDNDGKPTNNAPLRSGKGYAYEGGIRVPLIVRWPTVVPAGMTSSAPVCSIDLFPTIVEACGAALPADRPIDGLSLLPHLKSGGKAELPRDELIWHFPHYRHAPGPYSILRKGDWKLIRYWEGQRELYNLKVDLSEEANLAETNPEKVAELDELLVARLKSQQAKLPRPNPNFAGN